MEKEVVPSNANRPFGKIFTLDFLIQPSWGVGGGGAGGGGIGGGSGAGGGGTNIEDLDLKQWTRKVYMPRDEMIISDILVSWKMRGCTKAWNIHHKYVKEVDSHDVYGGGKHPSDLFSMHALDKDTDPYVYLLTTLPHPSEIGPWTLLDYVDCGTREPVKDPRLGNQLVGYKKVYIHDDGSGQDTQYGWLMTEYSTVQPPSQGTSLNYVLCKIEKIEYYDYGVVEEEEEDELEEGMRELKLDPESANKAAADAARPSRAA